VGLAETKDWLNQQNIDTSNDLELVRLINDVSDRMHYEAGREFKPISTASSARSFTIDWNGVCHGIVPVGDMAASPSQVRIIADDWTTVYTTVSTSVYLAWPEIRDAWKPIRALVFNPRYLSLTAGYRCEVTSTWGFPQVPGSIRQAALDAIAEIHDRQVEHYSEDLGPSTGGASNVVVFGNRTQTFSLPPRALAVARSYQDSLVG